MTKCKYQIGDVFKFSIDEHRHGYGQIVAAPPNDLKWFAIFDIAATQEMELYAVVDCEILILAQSMEAKLNRGDWQIIGNISVPQEKLHFLEYKEHRPKGWVVLNYEGKVLRSATKDDLSQLTNRRSFSPAALEYAIKAHLGLVERKDFCDKLLRVIN